MTKRVVARGNTVFFSFTFYDENDDLAICTSADVQLTYTGGSGDFETETVALTNSDNVWSAEWDSTKAMAGWIKYHAHAIAGGLSYAEPGRIRLRENSAGYDHDALPTTGTASSSAMRDYSRSDYGS